MPCVLVAMLAGCSGDGDEADGMGDDMGPVPSTDTIATSDGSTLMSGATDSDTDAADSSTTTDGDVDGCATRDGQPVVLWEGYKPWTLARDATHVYWSSSGALMRAAQDGTVETIAEDPMLVNGSWMAFDDDHVYVSFMYRNLVVSVPKAGGDVETILEGPQGIVRQLGTNSTVFYFMAYPSTSTSLGDAYGVPWDGGSPSLVSSGLWVKPFDGWLVDEDGALYWANNSGVARADPDGEHVWIADLPSWSYGMAMDEDHVYWTRSEDSYYELRRVPKTGGPHELLTSFPLNPGSPVIDGEHVYLRPSTKVVRSPVTGGPAEEIVDLGFPAYTMTVGNQAVHALVLLDTNYGAALVEACIPD